jgi:DNA replication protein DnaC
MKKPRQFENAAYADVPKEIQECFDAIKDTRQGIYIHGGVGCGKTYVAWALWQEWKDRGGNEPIFWNVSELVRSIKRDFDKHPYDRERSEEEVMEWRGVLFLDDLGAERLTDFVAEALYLIINRRYEEKLPTIITSNLDLGELSKQIGDRIASRITGMCDIVELKGEDRRI